MSLAGGGQHLLDYWSVLVRRRWIVYLSLATICLATLIGSFLVTPLYRATATLHIERQSPDIFTFRDLGQVDYSFAAYADFYQTQYKIIGSHAVARRAAERLELTSHPDFSPDASSPGLLGRLKSWIPRRGNSTPVDPEDLAALQVLGGLEVSPVRNSQLVQVSWTAESPELATQLANAVAAAYVQFNIESQFLTTDAAQEFLVNQVAHLKAEIATIEDRLQAYGEAKRIVSIDDSNNITLRALQDTSERLTAVRTTLAQAEAHHRSVMETTPDALSDVMRSELIARLRQEYATYEAEHSEKSRRFKEGWPGVEVLESKLEQARTRLELEIERIAGQVRASVKATYERARAEERNLEQLLTRQEDAAQRLRRDSVEFANLQSEVNKKREALNALMRRKTEMSLASRLKDLDSTSTNIRIVEQARLPTAPFRPNIKANLALAFLFSLTLGVGLAFFLDYLDNTINSAAELSRLVDLPTLAVIPRYDSAASGPRARRRGPTPASEPFDLISHRDSRAEAAEAYRELRTSILLSNPGRPPQRLLITSALPEEGKTATAINLATVLAQLGRRVLVVDTDLRRPRLHQAFQTQNVRGVSTYLSGLEDDPSALTVATGIENLDLLPSGPIPPNPSELLNSSRFRQMADELLARGYGHVVFDSPPVLSVSDPVILAAEMQSAILVVRAGLTPKQSVRAATEKFRQAGLAHVGVVLNDLDLESRGAGYHGYHYYGRYAAADDPSESDDDQAHGAGA